MASVQGPVKALAAVKGRIAFAVVRGLGHAVRKFGVAAATLLGGFIKALRAGVRGVIAAKARNLSYASGVRGRGLIQAVNTLVLQARLVAG